VDRENYIKVDRNMRINIPRIHAAGDITGGVRQIVTAVGTGAVAAVSAFEDLGEPYWKKT
jgi:thioredoxin reductase (NADPH)